MRPAQASPASVARQTPSADAQAQVAHLWRERSASAAAADYCIGPGDVLEVAVFRFPELNGVRARVSASGSIGLPLLGEIPAAGATELELQERIARRLRDGVMKDPKVTVSVIDYRSQQVSVTGAVARPGQISLTRDRRTVSDVISEAGGLTEHAGGKVLLYPGHGDACPTLDRAATLGGPTTLDAGRGAAVQIPLAAERAAPGPSPLDLPVFGGDAIVVDRGTYYVDGWVLSPGVFDISPGVTALGAVSAAGGPLFPADVSNVVVWRSEPSGARRRIDIDLAAITEGRQHDVAIESGDVISVPSSSMLMIPYGGYWIITNVIRVGASVPLL